MDKVSIIPLGGIGDVTKNMYVYECGNELLLVDCGIGFADQTVPGVDFLIPDISYIKTALGSGKKIVGMILTHGHEDHIGALPFILPSLPNFTIHATPLTSALVNEKLKDFSLQRTVRVMQFQDVLNLGRFSISFVHMTHSILDAANLVIKTPVGVFYHGSDYKFDFTPVDDKPSEVRKIARAGDEGVLCLLSDSVGAERKGYTPSEKSISARFEEEVRKATGKVFVTTYSSNVSRMNQAVEAGLKYGRKICFIGRSFQKVRDVAKTLGYMKIPAKAEIKPHEVKRFRPNQVLILLAGSQGQIESGLVRIATDEDRDLRISKDDTIIFSADPIPGNEVNVNSLVDTLSKKGARVLYSTISRDFHVSGHGSENDIKLMISLTAPRFVFPMGGTYKQLVAFSEIAKSMGYKDNDVVMIENGQEIVFTKDSWKQGRRIATETVYVDQITGEEVEDYVIIDRLKIANEGIVIAMVEVNSTTGEIASTPDIITKGFTYPNKEKLAKRLGEELQRSFRKRENVPNWRFYKKMIQEKMESILYKERREPMVIPVVVEV